MLREKSEELAQVMKIIKDGRAFFKEHGINQQQQRQPSKGTITNNVNKGISYVFEIMREILGTVILTTLYEDYEKYPIFSKNTSYLVIHSLVTIKYLRNQVITHEFLQSIQFFSKIQNINFLRTNTYLNNNRIRKFLSNFGFV